MPGKNHPDFEIGFPLIPLSLFKLKPEWLQSREEPGQASLGSSLFPLGTLNGTQWQVLPEAAANLNLEVNVLVVAPFFQKWQ